MQSVQKAYKIHFGIERRTSETNKNKNEISIDNVGVYDEFTFMDYDSSSTFDYLKEYFLTTFYYKYKEYNFCKCVLSVYYKKNKSYILLSKDGKKKLSEFNQDKLFMIRTLTSCKCELQTYHKYMGMKKFDVIEELKANKEKLIELKEYKKKFEELINELKESKKNNEIPNQNDINPENFYDIIIDINSIKSLNKEGWKVKFNENGLENYIKNRDKYFTKIGVIGNVRKGKSFILSKISKIKLLDGIHTKGLSVKYPELKGYKGRKIILIDSAGLETPILKNLNRN